MHSGPTQAQVGGGGAAVPRESDTHETSSKGFSTWELVEMLSLRELIRDSTSKVLWRGPATQAAFAWHRGQFETPWRKAGVQYKPYCLHSLSKASLLSPRAGENLSKIQVPRHQPRQPCKQACHVEKVGSTLLVSFCMCAISRGNHENNSEHEGFFF